MQGGVFGAVADSTAFVQAIDSQLKPKSQIFGVSADVPGSVRLVGFTQAETAAYLKTQANRRPDRK
jgi:hypothetical protein